MREIKEEVGLYISKENLHQFGEFVSTYKEIMFSMHMDTTRYLKCPKYNKRSWTKKAMNNNKL